MDELIAIAREARLPAEIYHLKAAGQANWAKLDDVIAQVEAARAEGLQITADMYTYTAGSTGLDAAMPPWVQEGGHGPGWGGCKDPASARASMREMRTPTDAWENLLLNAGARERAAGRLRKPALRPLAGKTLAEVARAARQRRRRSGDGPGGGGRQPRRHRLLR